jgi:surface antigen
MLVLQPVHAPQTCDNTIEYRQEYDYCQERKIEYKTNNHTVLKKYPSNLGGNCVSYAKSRSDVPMGVSTYSQKLSHIKTHNAEVGKIGVTKEGAVGHLVVVEEVKEHTIVISEGNYMHGFVTWRELDKDKIEGYY